MVDLAGNFAAAVALAAAAMAVVPTARPRVAMRVMMAFFMSFFLRPKKSPQAPTWGLRCSTGTTRRRGNTVGLRWG
jgi:hypothetical protein